MPLKSDVKREWNRLVLFDETFPLGVECGMVEPVWEVKCESHVIKTST